VVRPALSDGAAEDGAEWITIVEAARRLGMSASWFQGLAKEEGIEVRKRGGKPGVNWSDVERYIASARISG
jgi:hypothetical protein